CMLSRICCIPTAAGSTREPGGGGGWPAARSGDSAATATSTAGFTTGIRSTRDAHLGLQHDLAIQRVRNEAVVLGFLEQPVRAGLVCSCGHVEHGADAIAHELEASVLAIQRAFDLAGNGQPVELR